MGTALNCLNRDENINNILKRNNEINEDDFLNFDNDENNFLNIKDEITKNISNSEIEKKDNLNENKINDQIIGRKVTEQYIIYSIKDLTINQLLKLRQLLVEFNNIGKIRSSNDFSENNWKKF